MPTRRICNPARPGALLGFLAGALTALPSRAQEQPAVPPAPSASPAGAAQEGRLDELERQLTQVATERQESELHAAEEEEHRLKLFGFTDFVVGKISAPENSEAALVSNRNLFFTAWHLNLFLDKRLSGAFHTQAEVRFTWLPLGTETSLESPTTTYTRTDTTVQDPFVKQDLRWGSIIIERAWIEYQPRDWLGVRVGRFLTPYGIWNEEHGTPVLIPARQPIFLTVALMPTAQTGFWVHGRAFPLNGVSLDYGVTVSNGRGPLDEIADLDSNKAVGARLRATWQGEAKVSLGAYYYTGDYTDLKRRVTQIDPLRAEEVITVAYTEHTIAGDLLVEWGALRFQAEVLYGSVAYHGQRRELDPISQAPLSDHLRNGGYGLLAYRLPFRFAELRPYLMYDHYDTNNYLSGISAAGNVIAGGINWRITPETVAKAELLKSWVARVSPASTFEALALQLATTF